jgi:hypothetical protein
MGKLDRIEEKMDKLAGSMEQDTNKKKFRFPGKIARLAKKSDKSPDHVLVQYLTVKQQILFKLCKIVSGNLIVIKNKVHVLNPNRTWRYGKHIWYIVREIDRKPVSNVDYNKVIARGDDTDADVPLIKAVLGAVQKQQTMDKKNIWMIVIIAIIALVALFMFMG